MNRMDYQGGQPTLVREGIQPLEFPDGLASRGGRVQDASLHPTHPAYTPGAFLGQVKPREMIFYWSIVKVTA